MTEFDWRYCSDGRWSKEERDVVNHMATERSRLGGVQGDGLVRDNVDADRFIEALSVCRISEDTIAAVVVQLDGEFVWAVAPLPVEGRESIAQESDRAHGAYEVDGKYRVQAPPVVERLIDRLEAETGRNLR